MIAESTDGHFNVTKLQVQDLPSVFPLLELGYSGRATKSSEARWRWQYERNPLRTGPEFDTWVIKDQSTIVAQRPTMPVAIKVGDAYHQANYLTDFMVHPDSRDKGLGTLMQRQVVDDVDICVSLDASMRSRTIFGKLGFTWLGEVPRFVRVCDPMPYVSARLGGWTRPLGPPIRAGWDWAHRADRGSTPGIQVESATEFGPEIDDLWERLAPRYPVIARRDSTLLNWRYVRAPDDASILLARRDKELTGYAVFRTVEVSEQKRGFVCDLLAAPDDEKSLLALLRGCVNSLGDDGVQAIDTYAFHPTLQAGLRKLGFVRKPGVSFIVHTTLGGRVPPVLREPENWYVTALDSDLDPVFR